MAVAVTVVGTIGAIVFPMDDITGFLYLIGSVFAPMIAIQIADYFILHRDRRKTAFDTRNLVIWVIGFVLYRILIDRKSTRLNSSHPSSSRMPSSA